ncbi:MAG: D-alanyl-D-alanine carboxypeptidase/D-alanyl-D-alanine-endopeptidase [Gammaproteobacteria bacterium]|nr:D-alanyl-D-alanine carboxypeptidase/D-alanyl-D-alanine-endopeptidase [Gammaproteobacteria bacterium]
MIRETLIHSPFPRFTGKLLIAAACAGILPGFAPASHAADALAPLKALQDKGADVSALVMRLDNGKVLAELDPDTALVPASTSKLYVTTAALLQWGSEHRFRTRFLATGPIVAGTLHGDLVFAGAGDPSFTNETLAKLVRRLDASGLKRVSGDLIVNAGWFGPLHCMPEDRCDARESSHNSYDAGLSSAAVNFSNTAVAVTPAAEAGNAAQARQVPYALPSFTLHNSVETTRNGNTVISLSRSTQDQRARLSLRGRIPVGANTRRYYVAVGDPDRYAGEQVRAFLDAAGIRIEGRVRTRYDWPPSGREIAAVKSQPLWIQLRRMLVWSNNFMADTLALDLLREHQKPPLSLVKAGALLTRIGRKLEKQSALMKGNEPQLELDSGSGLTPASRASARDLAALLDVLYHRPDLFPGFLATLTVPAHTPVGMLKARGKPMWMKRLAVKSGSFHGGFKVFSLAGYLRFPDGSWGAFAALVNGTKKYQPPVPTAIAATRKSITAILKR